MAKKSTAKKIKQLTNYAGDVGLYQLSKQMKQGSLGSRYIVVSKTKGASGTPVIHVWLADEDGRISQVKPITGLKEMPLKDAFFILGYEYND